MDATKIQSKLIDAIAFLLQGNEMVFSDSGVMLSDEREAELKDLWQRATGLPLSSLYEREIASQDFSAFEIEVQSSETAPVYTGLHINREES